jgi:hypothetical protein
MFEPQRQRKLANAVGVIGIGSGCLIQKKKLMSGILPAHHDSAFHPQLRDYPHRFIRVGHPMSLIGIARCVFDLRHVPKFQQGGKGGAVRGNVG